MKYDYRICLFAHADGTPSYAQSDAESVCELRRVRMLLLDDAAQAQKVRISLALPGIEG